LRYLKLGGTDESIEVGSVERLSCEVDGSGTTQIWCIYGLDKISADGQESDLNKLG